MKIKYTNYRKIKKLITKHEWDYIEYKHFEKWKHYKVILEKVYLISAYKYINVNYATFSKLTKLFYMYETKSD